MVPSNCHHHMVDHVYLAPVKLFKRTNINSHKTKCQLKVWRRKLKFPNKVCIEYWRKICSFTPANPNRTKTYWRTQKQTETFRQLDLQSFSQERHYAISVLRWENVRCRRHLQYPKSTDLGCKSNGSKWESWYQNETEISSKSHGLAGCLLQRSYTFGYSRLRNGRPCSIYWQCFTSSPSMWK